MDKSKTTPSEIAAPTSELAAECIERADSLDRSNILGEHGGYIIDNLRRAGAALSATREIERVPVQLRMDEKVSDRIYSISEKSVHEWNSEDKLVLLGFAMLHAGYAKVNGYE